MPGLTFRIPLSKTDLEALGRIGATWAQMDYLLVQCIARLLNISMRDCERLFEKTPTGPRVSAFKHFSASLESKKAKGVATSFNKKVASVLGKRNHLTHGMWGLFAEDGERRPKPACYHPQNKAGLIYASELNGIATDAASVANLLAEFLSLDSSAEIQTLTDRILYMGYGPPEGRYTGPPGSVYLDLANLGHSPQQYQPQPKSSPK